MDADTLVRRPPVAPGATNPIDPRLRARRNEVARHQGRRRLRRLVALIVVAVGLVGAAALTRTPVLDVDHVTVTGAGRTGTDAARAAAGVDRGRAMVSVDLGAARARLEALPWVLRATVARRWPGTVAVTLVERRPVAVVGRGFAAVLVDRDGRILGPPSPRREAVPVVHVPAGPPGERLGPRGRTLVAVVAGLPADLRRDVVGVRPSSKGVELELRDAIAVRWGDASQPVAKADAVRALLRQADRRTIATVDVTVPATPALTRRVDGER